MGGSKRERRIAVWIDTLNDSFLSAARLSRDDWAERTGRWVNCATLVRIGDVDVPTSCRVNGTVNSTFARGLHHCRQTLRRPTSLDHLIAGFCLLPNRRRDVPIRLPSGTPTINWVSGDTAFITPGWFGERRLSDAYLGGIYANVRSRTYKRRERNILRRRLNELWGDETEIDADGELLYLTWCRDRGFVMRDPRTSDPSIARLIKILDLSETPDDNWYCTHEAQPGHNAPRVPGRQRGRRRRYARRRALLNADTHDVFGLTKLFNPSRCNHREK